MELHHVLCIIVFALVAGHSTAALSFITNTTQESADFCISTTVSFSPIMNRSQCLGVSVARILAEAAITNSTAFSSKLVLIRFNVNGTQVNTTVTRVVNTTIVANKTVNVTESITMTNYTEVGESYPVLSTWTQVVLTSFIKSLNQTRQNLFVRLPTVSLKKTYTYSSDVLLNISGTASILNTTTSLSVLDLGLAYGNSALPVVMTGYLMDLKSVAAIVDGNGYNLVYLPWYHSRTLAIANALSGYVLVTFPQSGSAFQYFGAVYPFTTSTVPMLLLQNLGREYNLKVGVVANGTVSVSGQIDPLSVTDNGALDTSVPTNALPNAVTDAPTTTVIATWVWVVVGLGVAGLVGVCIFGAKRASLRREDHKRTAKRRKAEAERFDKMARDLGKDIHKDDDGDVDLDRV